MYQQWKETPLPLMKPTVCFLMFAQQATWVKGNMMTGQRKRKRCVLNQALHCTRRRHLKMGTVSSSVMTTSPLSVQKRQQEVILAGLLYVESISDDDNTMAKECSQFKERFWGYFRVSSHQTPQTGRKSSYSSIHAQHCYDSCYV